MSRQLREAIREELRRRNGGGKGSRGPGDLVKEDRDAGPNIHMDDNTWTVATPEEFRRGMRVAPDAPPSHDHELDMNQEAQAQHHFAQNQGKPVGRVRRFDELEQLLAQKMRSDDEEEADLAHSHYTDVYGDSSRRRKRSRPGFTVEKKKVRE